MYNTHYRAKSNKRWVYGYLYNNCDYGVNQNFIVRENDEGMVEHLLVDNHHDGISICTMLKDKNGNFIYEGDFIVDEVTDYHDITVKSYYPVVYCQETGCWCVDNSHYKHHSNLVVMTHYFGNEMEVDGNIFDNPDRMPADPVPYELRDSGYIEDLPF